MKKKLYIASSVFVIALISFAVINPNQIFTTVALRLLGHFDTPEDESSESLKNYVDQYDLYYDRLYRVHDVTGLTELINNGVEGVPTVQIYDHEKRLLRMATENDCTWALANYFKSGHSDDMVINDSTTYSFVMNRLEPIDLKSEQDTFDFYVISYWAKYLPKLSQRLFVQTNSMKDSMPENICFMYVSLDQQEGWDME